MSKLPLAVPLSPTPIHGSLNGFAGLHDLDQAADAAAIAPIGSINVDLMGAGGKSFYLMLVGDIFCDPGPRIRVQPATIDLSEAGLFNVVQLCRERWETALASVKEEVFGPGDAGTTTRFPYEEAWHQPVDERTFSKVVANLAVAGDKLFHSVFEGTSDSARLARKLRTVFGQGEHAVTVNAPDFHLPWRMLYTHPVANEALRDDGSNFDKAGFWGYQHIIEQFVSQYNIVDHVAAADGKVAIGAALAPDDQVDGRFNVACVSRHKAFVHEAEARLVHTTWQTKDKVLAALSAMPFPQRILYFLCHAEAGGSAEKPLFTPSLLKLDSSISTAEIREALNRGFMATPPFVFINACRGGLLGTLVFHNHTFAAEFLKKGASCLLGPNIEVPAVFAGEFGKRFLERFTTQTAPPPRAGIVLRDLTRWMWNRRNPLGLVYSLYGPADCHIRWNNRGET